MKALALRAAALVVAAVLALVGWFGGLHQSGNYHPVIAGEYYRAGQLSAEALSAHLAQDGIRSVVNLRGPNPGTGWYDAETAATAAAGVEHHDFRMSTAEELTAPEAARLIALLRDVPKPVLVHCEGGADRTGLATALYLAAVKGMDPEEAGAALSARYGHVGIEGVTRAWPMRHSWDSLRARIDALRASAPLPAN